MTYELQNNYQYIGMVVAFFTKSNKVHFTSFYLKGYQCLSFGNFQILHINQGLSGTVSNLLSISYFLLWTRKISASKLIKRWKLDLEIIHHLVTNVRRIWTRSSLCLCTELLTCFFNNRFSHSNLTSR